MELFPGWQLLARVAIDRELAGPQAERAGAQAHRAAPATAPCPLRNQSRGAHITVSKRAQRDAVVCVGLTEHFCAGAAVNIVDCT